MVVMEQSLHLIATLPIRSVIIIPSKSGDYAVKVLSRLQFLPKGRSVGSSKKGYKEDCAVLYILEYARYSYY